MSFLPFKASILCIFPGRHIKFLPTLEIYTIWNVYFFDAVKCISFLSDWLDSQPETNKSLMNNENCSNSKKNKITFFKIFTN